jgi:ribA/ribD-fused uncharacterized protein
MKFRDEYWFLSNMYPCDCTFNGIKFTCSESLFQALKCIKVSDMKKFEGLDGRSAKKLGREIKLRDDWNTYRLKAMRLALEVKFGRNPELRTLLKNTAPLELVEDNTWGDKFWGRSSGIGENHLGKLLMELRSHLIR